MLVPLDSLDILAIVDNEVDPMSPAPACVSVTGRLGDVALGKGKSVGEQRGGGIVKEMSMDQVCCGAHGLSLMLTGKRNGVSQTLLFDTGPTDSIFTSNAARLSPPLQDISHIHLSHWHRDHSGGMLSAIQLIKSAKEASSTPTPLIVDLHPNRPAYRGFMTPFGAISLEADPTLSEIELAGGKISLHDSGHEVLDSYFLVSGEIPRVTSYEHGLQRGARYNPSSSQWETDTLILDERFVVCHVRDKGLVLFTGCSHAGVVNAAKHSLTLTNDTIPLYAIVGGYHLVDADSAQIDATIQDLKALGVKVLIAGHCTGWRAKFKIEKEMPGALVPSFVGLTTII
ncbi:hypothetical protein CC78DRAFT_531873 [Lojkania enalia]|uniref:Metallo-beta-lactamase superfamily protein n=1 Tax=Lojkania enalia TaxID=147567 RepID=A0A9P4N5K2_9PLEO|nr:hypothetical protein CC78DRAFT_531873 [Didymosphaeria enalia]